MAKPDLEEDAAPEGGSSGRSPRLLPLILIFLILIVGGGGYLAFRFVPAVRQAAAKLPLVGSLIGGTSASTSVDPLKNEQLQIDQETAALQALQTQLNQQQADLAAKETDLQQREAAAQQLMTDAQALKDEYTGKLAGLDQQVKLYSAMKPDKAAAVMNELSDDTVARILIKLDSTLAAKIISYMQPARAAQIMSLMGS